MAAPIRIVELDAIEASDLVHALAARGLVGRIVPGSAERVRHGYVVVVHDAHEDTERLLGEVVSAVETWLDEHERETLQAQVETRVITVARHADLREALRSRLPSKTRRGG